jgi:hypothetical protein
VSADGHGGGQYRYGGVLALAVLVAVFALTAPEGGGARGIELLASGVTLLVAVLTSRARVRTRRRAGLGLAIAVIVAGAFSLAGNPHPVLTLAACAVLLGATAVVILAGLVRLVMERGVVMQAVLGALAVYVLVGLTFGFVIGALATGLHAAYFASGDAVQSDRVYFSFTTLTTTGYGDYAPVTRIGHALAVLEMLVGQLYLVTVISLLVGNLRRQR